MYMGKIMYSFEFNSVLSSFVNQKEESDNYCDITFQ